MIVTGVGTREPPHQSADLRAIIKLFTDWCNRHNHTLRSGGAEGMDLWFERCWTGPKSIYIAWEGFEPYKGATRRYHGVDGAVNPENFANYARARTIAQRVHPKWSAMKRGGKSLHSRNVYQVLGDDLASPSDIIVYYAKIDGDSVSGGTRTAVELSREYNIPEFNLILPDHIDRLLDYMEAYDNAT